MSKEKLYLEKHQSKSSGIEVIKEKDKYILTMSSTKLSRKNKSTYPILICSSLMAIIGFAIYRELLVFPDDSLSDTLGLSIFMLICVVMMLILLFRYHSNTTIKFTKDTIHVNRRIPLGLTYSNKRKTNNLNRIREHIDIDEGESLKGIELSFNGEWNLLIGQHLGRKDRQLLIRLLSQILNEINK